MPMNLANCPGQDCELTQATLPTTYHDLYPQTLMAGLGCGADCACASCGGVPKPYPLALSGFDVGDALKTLAIPVLAGALIGWAWKAPVKGAVYGGAAGLVFAFLITNVLNKNSVEDIHILQQKELEKARQQGKSS